MKIYWIEYDDTGKNVSFVYWVHKEIDGNPNTE